jgi:putative ABC transport system ATP-binding protein
MIEQKIVIRLDKLSKSYTEGKNSKVVLNNISLEVPKGSIIALLGKSGSGKTTLLNLISGIDVPDSGEIVIYNKDLSRLNEQQRTIFRRNHIGFIFQFFNLLPTLTVKENLLLPLELAESDDVSRIPDLLEKIGLSDRLNSYPDILSGGEQQRIAIARALVHDPNILLADEPTGNLDFETGRQVIGLLEKLAKENGKTLIMATHSLELAEIADKIYSIKNGQISLVSEKV